MKSYLKLFDFELRRVMPLFLGGLGLFALMQFAVVFIYTQTTLNEYNAHLASGRTAAEFLMENGPISISLFLFSPLYVGPLIFLFGALFCYALLIWYKEWYGSHPFIHRLLMLPNSRMHVYFAKLSAIAFMAIVVYAFQLCLYPLQDLFLSLRLPNDILETGNLNATLDFVFIHVFNTENYFMDLFIMFGCGLFALTTIFTMVLIERSFRLIGIAFALSYGGVVLCAATVPLGMLSGQIYDSERFFVGIALVTLLIAINLLLSRRLIAKYVTV
ncbi:hypothetical protein [Shouchella clausii]|uniref:hypothetical protein n=1 Tax=Shouchella clausii TaxID=79880 RepID=UPI000BA63009|nr:hypothetical protein [Shouchella clausii]PAD13432.1 hypothetical protein CHH73_20515 [Shouchella clausii]PAE82986.1 hypothetical protein CHH77_08520 [Shouchella clausii]